VIKSLSRLKSLLALEVNSKTDIAEKAFAMARKEKPFITIRFLGGKHTKRVTQFASVFLLDF
jgi:hypothetical protein